MMFAVKGLEGLFEYLELGEIIPSASTAFQRIDDHDECSLAAVGVNLSFAP